MGQERLSCFSSFFLRIFRKSRSCSKMSSEFSGIGEDVTAGNLKVCFSDDVMEDDVFEEETSKKDEKAYDMNGQEGFDFRTRSSFKAMLLKTPLLSSRRSGGVSQDAELLSQKMGFLGQIYVESFKVRRRFKSASTGSLNSKKKNESFSSDSSK